VLQALVFDFDGLILDTERPIYESWRRVYRAEGHELDLAKWQSIIGMDDVWDPADDLEVLVGRPLDREALADVRRTHRNELLAAEKILPGVLDLLEAAKAAGLATAVASSSPIDWVEDHLARLGLVDAFAHLSCRGPGRPAKPEPHVYLAAVEALGVEPAEAVALEDSAHGVRAAKAAGLWCVAVPHDLTRDSDLSAADLVVDSLAAVSLEDLRQLAG
jgi:HAD superfamily hydrolase (TIGR01509 family)